MTDQPKNPLNNGEFVCACPDCRGTGSTGKETSRIVADDGSSQVTYLNTICPKCKGSGSLVVSMVRAVEIDPAVKEWIYGKQSTNK